MVYNVASDLHVVLITCAILNEKGASCRKLQGTGHEALPAYSGIAPLERRKIAIALPITSWMSQPMIAISIMIHISNLGALGYSALQATLLEALKC